MEIWLLYALATGILFGLQTVCIKKLTPHYSQHMVMAALFLVAAITFIPFLNRFTIKEPMAFSLWAGASFLINIFAFSLLYTAIKNAPVSLVAPFLNLTPLFIIFTGILVVGEHLSARQILGIVVILGGAFLLQFSELRAFLVQGQINRNMKSILLAILVSFLWSFTSTIEKRALLVSNTYTYGFLINLALGIYFGSRVLLRKKEYLYDIIKSSSLIFLGIISGAMALVQYQAIVAQKVGPVIAYKRAGVIISILYGVIVLKEKTGYDRLVGAMAIIAGGFLLAS